ncbi:MAG: hypothetical protein LBM77_10735 [Spirochaetaceae bacterium]|jgi:hypothetical protein|nr:hypothetical protein [Spirochaetaceae bacterium]
MIKEELIAKSPVRVFMKAIGDGLKAGEVGIVASPSGLGKTSVLVQIALDKLLQGKKVIHVSFTKYQDHVLAWYDNLFEESVGKKNLEDLNEVKDELVRNRVFLKFTQDGVKVEQILHTIKALVTAGEFDAKTIIVDGFDFNEGDNQDRLQKVRDFGKEYGLAFWYSCNTTDGAPFKAFENLIDVIVALEPQKNYIKLDIVKDRATMHPDTPELKLDTKSLLLLA